MSTLKNNLINWFWSNPWNENNESTEQLMQRLGLYRIFACLTAIWVAYIQDKHVLTLDIHGKSFYFYDRVMWYFDLLNITHSYPLFDVINLYIAIFAFLLAAVGYRFRLSLAIGILSLYYIHGSRSALIGNNHHVLISWGHVLPILFFSRAGEVFSLSKYKNKEPIEKWEAIWPIRTIQIALVIFYTAAGIAKFRAAGMGWLVDGSAIQRIVLSRWQAVTPMHNFGVWLVGQPTLCWMLSAGIVVLEMITPLMLFVRWKYFNYFMVISYTLFHLFTRLVVGLPFQFNAVLLLVFIDHAPFIFSVVEKIKGAQLKVKLYLKP